MSRRHCTTPAWCTFVATTLLLVSMAANAGEALFAGRIYQPEPMPGVVAAWNDPAPVEVSVQTADGLTLKGYYWAPSAPDGTLVVFFHGNAGNRVTAAAMVAPLVREGNGILVASYRGYGDNPGTPSQEGLFDDGAAFLAKARVLAPDSPVVLFGYSLGGAVALELAARETVRGVVTLGAFSSLRQMAPRLFGGLLNSLYDNASTIKRVEEPVLLLHGTADEVVPFAQSRTLQSNARRARIVRLEGAPHRIELAGIATTIWSEIRQMPQ